MRRSPTFEQLRQANELEVVNPASDTPFIISLRSWQNTLWAVRVIPGKPKQASANPFTTAHRLMSRPAIEEWLSRLQLA